MLECMKSMHKHVLLTFVDCDSVCDAAVMLLAHVCGDNSGSKQA